MSEKPFLVFSGDHYYPCGGWDDLQGEYATIDEAVAAIKAIDEDYQWWHIIDMRMMTEVANSRDAKP